MPDTVTVGIVGTGVGIRTHLAGMQTVSAAQVLGVAGRSREHAAAHLRAAGAPVSLACSFEELLDRSPALVCLCTPPLEREQYLEPLAQSGATLLVEKPVGASYGQAAAELSVLEGTAPAFTNLQLRGLPAIAAIRERIVAGELGHAYSLRAEERTAAFRGDAIAPWQQHRRTGGGQRLAMGPHLLDLALFLLGAGYDEIDLQRLTGRGSTATPRGSWAQGISPDGVLADETFRAAFEARGCWIDLFTTSIATGPRTLSFEIEGTEGLVRFNFSDGVGVVEIVSAGETASYSIDSSGSMTSGEPTPLNPSVFRIAYPSYAKAVVAQVGNGKSNPHLATLSDGLANLDVLDRLVAGAASDDEGAN
jgi:predicted dehydrogenase